MHSLYNRQYLGIRPESSIFFSFSKEFYMCLCEMFVMICRSPEEMIMNEARWLLQTN